MKKTEFLENLRLALASRVGAGTVTENIRYYEDYINTQIRMGKDEEEVVAALGDPRLLARSIAEANKHAGVSESDNTYESENNYQNRTYQSNTGYNNSNQQNQNVNSGTEKFHMPVALIAFIAFLVIIVFFGLAFSMLYFLWPILVLIIIVICIIRMIRRT